MAFAERLSCNCIDRVKSCKWIPCSDMLKITERLDGGQSMLGSARVIRPVRCCTLCVKLYDLAEHFERSEDEVVQFVSSAVVGIYVNIKVLGTIVC